MKGEEVQLPSGELKKRLNTAKAFNSAADMIDSPETSKRSKTVGDIVNVTGDSSILH